MRFSTTSVLRIAAFCCLLGPIGISQARGGYSAAGDFSATSNPNGVWTYGWSQALGSAFVADAIHQNISGIDFWEGSIASTSPPGSFPTIFHNGTSGTLNYGSTITLPSGQLALHPGPDGEYSDVRFTTPTAGTYTLGSAFSGLDTFGTTTDVHVLLNGTSIFDGLINGYGMTAVFDHTLTLKAGDTLDFKVGYGSNSNFYNDSTELTATLTSGAVPEPPSFCLVGLGLLGPARGPLALPERSDRPGIAPSPGTGDLIDFG